MFYLFQKVKFLQILLLVGLLAAVSFFSLLGEASYFCSDGLPYFSGLVRFFTAHPVFAHLSAICVALLEAFLIFRYFNKNAFSDETTFMPACWFLALLFLLDSHQILSSVGLTNLVILLIININGDYQGNQSKNSVFISAILLGLLSLCDLSAVPLFVYYIFILAINRIEKMKDILVAFVGVLLPYVYVFAHRFFTESLDTYWQSFAQIRFHFPLFDIKQYGIPALVAFGLFLLFIPYIIMKLKVHYDNKLMILRKRMLSLNLLFIFMLGVMACSNVPFPHAVGYLAVPLACYFAAYIPHKRISWAHEITLTLLLAALVVMVVL